MSHRTTARGAAMTRRELLQAAGLTGLAATLPWGLAGCGGGDRRAGLEATIAAARAEIQAVMQAGANPALSVALSDRDRVIWAEAFGVIDPALGTPATPDTLFCIGSCSKLLAAVAVMRLAELGRLELDAPLVRYLPSFRMASPEYTQITPRMLISHAAGFPGTDSFNAVTGAPFTGLAAQLMRQLATTRLKHLPGEMSVYSNDAFTMVEPLVGAVAGMPYPEFVTQQILRPLGMLRSGFATEAFPAGAYAPGMESGRAQPQLFANVYASGGLFSTPAELARLLAMLMNGGELDGVRLLSPAQVQQMARDQTRAQPLRRADLADGYGLGWDGGREEGLAVVGVTAWHKSGAIGPYRTQIMVLPEENLALTITATGAPYGEQGIAERVLLRAMAERRRIVAVPAPLRVQPLSRAPVTLAQAEAVAGLYANAAGLARLQAQADASLALSVWDGQAWSAAQTLWARSDGTWSADASPAVSYRARVLDGRAYLSRRRPGAGGHYLTEFMYAQHVPLRPPMTAAWQARIGRTWLLANGRSDYDDGTLQDPTFVIGAFPDLPGYVSMFGQALDASASDTVAGMWMKIPENMGRDMNDLVIDLHDGQERLAIGSVRFVRRDDVALLAPALTIDDGLTAAWRALPRAGAVRVQGASAWRLYDAQVRLLAQGRGDGLTPVAAAGALLMVFAEPGMTVRLELMN